MATNNVLFRVDAGPEIGLGHLQRCLSLALALQRRDTTCVFLRSADPTVQDQVAASGFHTERLDGVEPGNSGDLKQTLAMLARYRCDAVVVDSYHVEADYLGRLRAAGLFVVAVDDLARYPFPCQLVVNGGAYAPQMPYRALLGDTTFLLGAQYALLRPEFWNIPTRTVRDTVRTLLVTLGGADPHNLMPGFLGLLDGLPADFTVTAIVGPFFENRAAVEHTARGCLRVVQLVDGPESLRDLMLEADLAVSAGGQTLYELAATGTPTVAVEVANNQAPNLKALAADGVLRVAGCLGQAGLLDRLGETVQTLLDNQDARATMSGAGQRLVDGRGAVRVAEVMVKRKGALPGGETPPLCQEWTHGSDKGAHTKRI